MQVFYLHDVWIHLKNVEEVHDSVELPIDACVVKRREPALVELRCCRKCAEVRALPGRVPRVRHLAFSFFILCFHIIKLIFLS